MNNDLYNLFMGNDETSRIIEKGIYNNNLLLYYRNGYFHVQISFVRCFKFSTRRAKNSLHLKTSEEVKKLFIKCINDITIEKQNENKFYLNICYSPNLNKIFKINHKIKLKEINDFLSVSKNDNSNTIIQKQNEKILLLLEKIKSYEEIHKELNTDDEMFIMY